MQKLLFVIDMQNDFIDGALGSAEATAIVERAAAKIRRFEGTVFVTLDTHGADYLQSAEGRKLPVPHCIRGTQGWELNARIAAALADRSPIVIEKPSFGSTELPHRIAEVCGGAPFEGEFIGLCTDICVVSNALLVKAAFPEMELRVDAACCAGVTPEAHRAALQTMRSCQIEIVGE